MQIDIHHHHHFNAPDDADPRIDRILNSLTSLHASVSFLTTKVTAMSQSFASFDDALLALTGDVENLTTVDTAAQAAFTGLQAQLATALAAAQNAGASPAQLQSFSDLHAALGSQITALSAAIPANTNAATA